MTTTTLGQRIAAARKRRGMNQRELADAAEVSIDTIRKLEQGQRHSVRIETLAAIAAAVDTDVSDLLDRARGLIVGAEDGEVGQLRPAVLDLSVLIGRDREIGQIEAALSDLSRGEPVVIELVGEPGIGKSRMLEELVRCARPRGVGVFRGRAQESTQGEPLSVFREAIPLGEPDEVEERHAMHRKVSRALEELAGETGLLLALDDMHWADEASADLLAFLLRRPPRAAVLIALAYRPRQLPLRLAAALTETGRWQARQRLELAPLGTAAGHRLLGVRHGPSRRAALYRMSGGVPLYLHILREHPEALRDDAGAGASPLLAELSGLAEDVLAVARAAAVVGEPVEPELVAATAELPDRKVLDSLDELVARDLIRDGAFRHPLLRKAVYSSAPPGWILRAHRRAADFLVRHGASRVSLAYHVVRSARLGDTRAIALLIGAAGDVERLAPATAAQWYETALRLTPDDGRDASLRYRLACALGVSGQLDRAGAEFRKALAADYPDGPTRRRMVAMAAATERMLGRPHESAALLEGELARDGAIGPGAAPLLLELAYHRFVQRRTGEHRDFAVRAYADVVAHDDQCGRAAAAVLLCLAECEQPDVPAALDWLAEVRQIVDAMTDAMVGTIVEIFVGLGYAETFLDACDDAVRHLRRAVGLASAAGQEYLLSPLLSLLAEAYLASGQLAPAAECAADAIDAALLNGHDQARMVALGRSSEIALWAGDVASALATAVEAAAIAESFKDWPSDITRAHLAAIRAFAGEPGAAEVFAGDGADADLAMLSPVILPRAYGTLVTTALLAGHRSRAVEWAERAEATAKPLGLSTATGHAHLARAAVSLPDQAGVALDNARKAAACFGRAGARLGLGRALLLVGEALAAQGDTAAAATELDQAAQIFTAAGAHGLLALAIHLRTSLSRLDVYAALTARQREVAGLVTEGLGNRQIARRLGVREKTVEAHVSSVMRKLGVDSRAAVAGILARSRP